MWTRLHILREASAVCPFYYDGRCQSLYAWNGQNVQALTLFFYNLIAKERSPAAL